VGTAAQAKADVADEDVTNVINIYTKAIKTTFTTERSTIKLGIYLKFGRFG